MLRRELLVDVQDKVVRFESVGAVVLGEAHDLDFVTIEAKLFSAVITPDSKVTISASPVKMSALKSIQEG